MGVRKHESELSKITSLTSALFNVLLVMLISVLGNFLYLYHRFTENLALNQPIISVNIPNNGPVKLLVTFLFWMIVGTLAYIVFIVSKSLFGIINEQYKLGHLVHHPSKRALLSESGMRLLSWVVFVLSAFLLLFTAVSALIPTAKVLFAAFTPLNALTYTAYALTCVFFLRCIALFSYVIKS